MVREHVHLSDWIQYLNRIVNSFETSFGHTSSSVFVFVALTVALFSLFINATSLVAFFASYGIKLETCGV